MRVKFIAVAFLYILMSFVGSVSAAEEGQADKNYQIVFSIFDDSSAGNYAYLRNSIQAMIASRLAAKERVNVLDKTFSTGELNAMMQRGKQETLSIGGQQADYLVTGTLFSLTSGLEIQVDLYPLADDNEILHFSVISTNPDTLIADVEKLSGEIAQTAFGVETVLQLDSSKVGGGNTNSAFITVHPEAAYKKNVYSGTIIGVAGSGVTTRGRGAKIDKTLPMEMTAMAVGDVTGDGQQDILVLAGLELKLYRVEEKAIVQLAETRLPNSLIGHALNLADLNGDGKEEIYISATDGLDVSSMILNFDIQTGFQVFSQNIRWYLRPILVPGKGLQLAGQKRGLAKIELVRPGIFLLAQGENGKITELSRLPLPESVNLFDFVYADLDGDTFYETVVVDRNEKLRVYSPGNQLMWVSKKNYGSSKIYLGPGQGSAANEVDRQNFTVDENYTRELIFVPGRILVTDTDGDGKEEVVVTEGKKTGFGYFKRLRFYESGAIVSLAWNGSSMAEWWRTGNFKGYVAGHGFSLLDEPDLHGNAGESGDSLTAKTVVGRLFVGNLPKSGTLADLLPSGGETKLTVYDLEFSKEKLSSLSEKKE